MSEHKTIPPAGTSRPPSLGELLQRNAWLLGVAAVAGGQLGRTLGGRVHLALGLEQALAFQLFGWTGLLSSFLLAWWFVCRRQARHAEKTARRDALRSRC